VKDVAANDSISGFCRDCLTRQQKPVRCERCGSPRVAAHAELYTLSLAHIDCDAFYASVEKRDRPELRDKPVIIGGGKRGVVSTACYIARINGVRSAMPMFKALEACPQAVVIKPDMEKYVRVGRQVREMMQALTPLVEPISIDEAFLDLSGTERLHGDAAGRSAGAVCAAGRGRDRHHRVGRPVLLQVPRQGRVRPRQAARLFGHRRSGSVSFLAGQPVTLIWGVGKAFAATLQGDGIRSIGQLQTMEQADLMRRYGSMGAALSSGARPGRALRAC
jgi:DNA polymerase-4